MIHVTVTADVSCADSISWAVRSMKALDVQFEVQSALSGNEAAMASRQGDTRSRLGFGEFAHLFIAFSVPLTYLIKKLADPTLEELGKGIAGLLRTRMQALRSRRVQSKRHLHLIIELGGISYVLRCAETELPVSEVSFVLTAALDHFFLLPQPLQETDALKIYELVLVDGRWVVKVFDPLG